MPRLVDAGLQHGEFVTADPRRHSTLTHHLDKPFGGFDQKAIAGRMAQHVVDGFETVEVEEV